VIIEAQGPNQVDDTRRFDAALEEAMEADLIVDAVVPKSYKERNISGPFARISTRCVNINRCSSMTSACQFARCCHTPTK